MTNARVLSSGPLTAGTNVTITGIWPNQTIAASGGGGSGGGTAVSLDRKTYTATANQTTFAVTYTVPHVDVFVNGARLSSADYTAVSGSSVVLAVALEAGDTVDLIGLTPVVVSPSSGSITAIFSLPTTVTSSVTLSDNGLSVGPIVQADGVTVTVADGKRWVIL